MNISQKTLRKLVYITSAVFAIFFGSPDNSLQAETLPHYVTSSRRPFTSSKCNEFTFDATKSSLPESSDISFHWDFGDGTSSSDPVVTHTYAHSGDYIVNLYITDNSGYECSTAESFRSVRVIIPPHASFISETHACVDEPVTLDANTSYVDGNRSLDYLWEFGDGEMMEGLTRVKKVYSRGGTYDVSLTVDDRSGTACGMQTVTKTVKINEPPKAEAGEDVLLRCVTRPDDLIVHFDASATTDPNGDDLTYLWDFGDGQQGKGVEVSHRYDAIDNYDVRLIVSDNTSLSCSTGFDFIAVKLNEAPQADAGEDITACVGEDISFNGARSYIRKKGTAVATWTFGDGASSNNLYAMHRYDRAGIYEATLSLENKLNTSCPISQDTRVVTINSTPVVKIKNISSGCANQEIFFDASSAVDPDGDELEYYWNFGDGSSLQGGEKVSHQYARGGKYRVSVLVDDKRGTTCSTATAFSYIIVNTAPIADAKVNASCCVEDQNSFSALGSSDPDGDELIYTWDFGDGSTVKGKTADHVYTKKGSYSVRLTVDDQSKTSCSQSSDQFVITVKEAPIAVIEIR